MRVRDEHIHGRFHSGSYQIHYSAKNRLFEARNLPPFLEVFRSHQCPFTALTETELQRLIKGKLTELEESATDWQKVLVYKLETANHDQTLLDARHIGLRKTAKALAFDFAVLYLQTVGDTVFYVDEAEWKRAAYFKDKLNPQRLEHSAYAHLDRLAYSEDLDAFFSRIVDGLGTLIEQVEERLGSPQNVLQSLQLGVGIQPLALPHSTDTSDQ